MTRYTLDYSTDNRPLYRRASYLRRKKSRFRTMLFLAVVFIVALIINQLRLHIENDRLAEQHRQAQFRYDSLRRQLPGRPGKQTVIMPATTNQPDTNKRTRKPKLVPEAAPRFFFFRTPGQPRHTF